MASRRMNVKAILADADLRRKLMVSTIQATQAREGIETSPAQADRAYYVVTEAEQAAFIGLKEFRAQAGRPEARHKAFVEVLQRRNQSARIDIRRADFSALSGASLAYKWVGILAPHFRQHAALDPAFADARQGLISTDSDRFVRVRWECGFPCQRNWVPYAKGGDFSRFYSDIYLRFDWTDEGREIKKIAAERYGSASRTIKCEEYYFRPGITWVEKTVKGMNARILPPGAIFNVAGPSAFPKRSEDTDFLLGLLNADLTQAFLDCFSSRSWGAEYVGRVPVPAPSEAARNEIGSPAREMHNLKAEWDQGNEISSTFRRPWLANASGATLEERLSSLTENEGELDTKLRISFSELNAAVFRLFDIGPTSRATIEDLLGQRPTEAIWPQMEGKTSEQKRMEHVWRLLSFAVKRVIDADDDGIVPFNRSTGETPLPERVRQELATIFPGRDESQLEVEIVNELKRSVKGYRKCGSLDDWLANAYFEYHAGLYKNRPIYWHIASAQGTSPFAFGALVHYHRFDKNRMQKLRASYVRDTIEELRRDAGLADKAGRADDRVELQAKLEEVQALDKKLQLLQEGHHEGAEGGDRDFRILTPWKEPAKRPKGWNPDLDDGVKVNIAPLDRAGILRVSGVAG
jgi:hypothetical protein